MRIIVSPAKEEPFLVEVEDTGTIADLKHALYVDHGYVPANLSIVFRGIVLEDGITLKSRGINDLSKVFIAYKRPKKPKRNKAIALPNSFLPASLSTVEDISECLKMLKQKNPKASYVFNDAETVSELVQRNLDPEIQLQRQREVDIILNHQEMHIGGFQEMVNRYRLIEEVYENAQADYEKILKTETVIPPTPAHPSTAQLPTPYGFEAKLHLMEALLKNMDPNNPNRTLIETFIKICSQTKSQKNTREPDEEEEESSEYSSVSRVRSKFQNHGNHVGFSLFDHHHFDDNIEDKEPQPVFPQIFHITKNPSSPSDRPTRFTNHDPSSDDDLGVE